MTTSNYGNMTFDAQITALALPELLSPILSHLDSDSLTNARLVSHIWNKTALRHLSSRCWVTLSKELFKQLRLLNKAILHADVEKLLTTYGHRLRSLKCHFKENPNETHGKCEWSIHKILTELAPQLQELWVVDFCKWKAKIGNYSIPKLVGPTNLQQIRLGLEFQPGTKEKVKFYLHLLNISPKLVGLKVYICPLLEQHSCTASSWGDTRRLLTFYHELSQLPNVTKGLRSLSLYGWRQQVRWSVVKKMPVHILSSIQLGDKLHTLRLHGAQFDTSDPQVTKLLSSIPNLYKIALNRCYQAKRSNGREIVTPEWLATILYYLPSLEILVITDSEFNLVAMFPEYADDVVPHNSLKQFILWTGRYYGNAISTTSIIPNVVNYFPNLRILALELDSRGKEIFGDVVRTLNALTQLKNLCLSHKGDLASEDFLTGLVSLATFPKLSRFTLVILGYESSALLSCDAETEAAFLGQKQPCPISLWI